jgi:hypothetical protein
LSSETATDVFAKTFHTVKMFDPRDTTKMLSFIELLVNDFSAIKEPHVVEIDGNQISFAS